MPACKNFKIGSPRIKARRNSPVLMICVSLFLPCMAALAGCVMVPVAHPWRGNKSNNTPGSRIRQVVFLCSLRSVVFQQMTWLDLLYYTILPDCASFYFDFAIRPRSSPPFIYSSRENIRRHSRSLSFCLTREQEKPSDPPPLRHFDPAIQDLRDFL